MIERNQRRLLFAILLTILAFSGCSQQTASPTIATSIGLTKQELLKKEGSPEFVTKPTELPNSELISYASGFKFQIQNNAVTTESWPPQSDSERNLQFWQQKYKSYKTSLTPVKDNPSSLKELRVFKLGLSILYDSRIDTVVRIYRDARKQ